MLSVTGANRGVGLALVQDLLEHKPSAVIFAGVRKIESLKAGDKLKDLADKHGDRLNLVQLSSILWKMRERLERSSWTRLASSMLSLPTQVSSSENLDKYLISSSPLRI
jgi:NAD(P)-dependent dehydrogenase (short-subunit alcohol dehydrogenase family)